ncbi:phosphotransferase family protein [Larkinella terrae]|uniref:Phosphotransferase n=1 Tax=Larkinella terrae TaxID=2025311 RepID=A0A7K0EHE2_9BACT|nr:phosphotransferase family protein [Larkinella terrae]MRS61132.1 phosphotransferase [Larkinella terrae]
MAELKPDSATAVRSGEELDLAVLNAYLNDTVPGFGSITECGQFPGGYSNLTYLLKTDAGVEFVLRRPPFGAKQIKGGHDMGREFRVLSLLQSANYPKIPEPVVFCEDETVLGCPFYVMKRVAGVILRAHTAPQMGISAETMRRMSESLVDNLVQLHALDIQKTGLIQLGKPEGYVRRQVEGWHRRYLNAQTDELPDMDALARWLTDHLPPENPPTLLHNDYKYDNVVLNPADLTDIRAVLDWEMCTVGNPLMDVGTALSYWAEAADGPFEKSFNLTWLPGNLTRQEVADRYAERSGRDLSGILYYYIFGLFKNSVVIQQIYTRYQKGLTQDPRFAELLSGVRALARKGTKSIEHNKM